MKNYKITSKVYVPMNVPISQSETLVIPKKGESITKQFDKLPSALVTYQKNNIITIEEV